jgi:hypothetical protein
VLPLTMKRIERIVLELRPEIGQVGIGQSHHSTRVTSARSAQLFANSPNTPLSSRTASTIR